MRPRDNRISFWAFPDTELSTNDSLTPLDNVQFIYELALAELELDSLGVKYQVMNGLRQFKLLEGPDLKLLRKRVAYFKAICGEYTDYFSIVRANRTRSVNQYLTHWIYPYKGKFHPQMIRALLNIIGLKEGDTVLDPFIGSGTTAVEAQLLGINCEGIDASPLCVLQSRVKTESIQVLPEIEDAGKEISDEIHSPLLEKGESTLSSIIDSIPEEKVRNFYKVAELIAHSDRARRRKQFLKSFIDNAARMLQSVRDFANIVSGLDLKLGKVNIQGGDARDLPFLPGRMDGIITSPPYSIALDYVANDAHALRALGCNLEDFREKFIGVRAKGPARITLYNRDMIQSFGEMSRVLRSGGFCVIVVGNASYQGEEIPTVQFTIEECQKKGLELARNIDKIIYGLYNIMQKENILIFQKS